LPTWSQYYPGDDVQITVSLHNNTDQELTFRSPGSGRGVYAYENEAGYDAMFLLYNEEPVWSISDVNLEPRTWLLLGAGESWEETASWDLRDGYHNQPVEPGQYELVFSVAFPLEYESIEMNWSEMSKQITVVPEPGTLSLLLTAGVIYFRTRRSRTRRNQCI